MSNLSTFCDVCSNQVVAIPLRILSTYSLIQYLAFVSEINNIRLSKSSNIVFSKSEYESPFFNIVLCHHQKIENNSVTISMLQEWNLFHSTSGLSSNIIDKKFIEGEDSIFDKKYNDFKSFCIEFDKLCCKLGDMNEDQLEEERECIPINTKTLRRVV